MQGIGRFIRLCVYVIGIPVILVLALYVWLDPFKVLRDYDGYAYPESFEMSPTVNKGMISLKNFERHYPQVPYNAFVFGSSVSIPYRVEYWKKYLGEDAVPMHFDSSAESPRSMMLKINYLLSQGVDIKYAILVIPPNWLGLSDREEPPYINRPEIDPDISWVGYHSMYLRAFLTGDFFRAYMASRLFGRNVRVSPVTAIDTEKYIIDPVTNQEVTQVWDDSVRMFTAEFYARRSDVFGIDRTPRMLDPQLAEVPYNAVYVDSIARMLRRAGTDYKVIIGPTLDKVYPAPSDMQYLRDCFGDRLYDFTVTMNYKADVDTNYFDRIHYRYPVALEMIDSAYIRRSK